MRGYERHLFRRRALERFLEDEDAAGIVHITPAWSWALLLGTLGMVVLALAVAWTTEVDVVGNARGVLWPDTGVRPLIAASGGTVRAVHVIPGGPVRAGERLVDMEVPVLQARLLELDRGLAALETQHRAATVGAEREFVVQRELVTARARHLEQQLGSCEASVGTYRHRFDTYQRLAKDGLVSGIAVDDAHEAFAQSERQAEATAQALLAARQELAALGERHHADVWQRADLVGTAHARRDALAVEIESASIRAPEDGVVEGLSVQPESVLQPGQVVGRLVPCGTSLRVVAFLAERDVGFVKVGADARLEMDELPYAEFGALHARITRVATDLATPAELEVFGVAPPSATSGGLCRIELRVIDDAAARRAGIALRSGMLMNVRFALRHQRVMSLLFEPLRRWHQ